MCSSTRHLGDLFPNPVWVPLRPYNYHLHEGICGKDLFFLCITGRTPYSVFRRSCAAHPSPFYKNLEPSSSPFPTILPRLQKKEEEEEEEKKEKTSRDIKIFQGLPRQPYFPVLPLPPT